MKAVIGLDYGTQSARALLVNSDNGEVLCSHTVKYPHGVIGEGLASAEDYEDALMELLKAVTPEKYRRDIVGICVDATSLTLVGVNKEGTVLSRMPEFADRTHAQIKLWKCHSAQPQSDEALSLAAERKEKFLGRTGGTVSCEWSLPKLMEIRDKDPEVYKTMDAAFDLCEFLTYRLTGEITRSAGSMGFKGLWSPDLGFPSEEYLNALRPGLHSEYTYLLRGKVLRPGDRAGWLRKELREELGIYHDVAVASGTLDGHTALVALGSLYEGDATLVVGTSTVLSIQTKEPKEVEGICGIAMNGVTPGLWGIDSGQNATGDMLEWFVKNSVPKDITDEAERRNVSPHAILAERIKEPYNNRVTAVDWWNGSRNVPCDLNLRGALSGLSLDSKPEDVYLALLQAIACGTGEVINQCASYGVEIKRVLATGGMTIKSPLLMQEYANLIRLPIRVGQVSEGPAMGAAVFAAVAAGAYPDCVSAYEHMGTREFIDYLPDTVHQKEYEAIYRRNHLMRQLIMELDRS